MTESSISLLYPRLGRETSRRLMAEQADLPLEDLLGMGATSHPEAAPAPTGGHPVDHRVLLGVQRRIRDVAADAGFPEPLKRGQEQHFDRPCANILFSTMGIVPADAADEGVWSFMSLVVTPEVGPWRFPDRPEDRLLGRPRNVFRRLWWRAWALGADLDAAPEGCTPLGEDEFVQIMERPVLGGNRRTARALRDVLWRAEAGGSSVARSELMRQIARRLRALRSHIALDALSDEQLRHLLDDLAATSHHDLSGRDLIPAPLPLVDSASESIPDIRDMKTAETAENALDTVETNAPATPMVTVEEEITTLVSIYTDRHKLVTKGEMKELEEALRSWLESYSFQVLVTAILVSSTLGGIEDQARQIQKRLNEIGDRSRPE